MRGWSRRLLMTVAVTGVLALTTAGTPGTAVATASADRTGTVAQGDVLDALRALPGLRVIEERPADDPGYRFFVLGLRQPVDHTDPTAGTFEQRLTLLHTSADRPTVLFTTGYAATLTPRRTEAAVLLGANQLQVEHRYFGTSQPAPRDFTYLTVRQAADDHHRAVRLFRGLYPGAWISTGSSKGGMATVYHRRFHPHDVDGTIVHSAPNNVDDRDDSAYVRFLETVGTPEARAALRAVQREILLRRDEITARYEAWAASTNTAFRILGGADKALETAVLRVPLMFWQRHTTADAAAIPTPGAPADALYAWLDAVTGLPLYADSVAVAYVPYFYQLGTQLGYLDVPKDHLADLLRYPDALEPRNFVPRDIPMRFDAHAMRDIDRWVRRHGTRLLFVNGTADPSVAEPFHPGGRDSRTFWAPGANHGADLADLTPADRAQAERTLRRWAARPGKA